MNMSKFDAVAITSAVLLIFVIILIGGVYEPNTLAGSFARFMFSLR